MLRLILCLSLASGAISYTISKTKLFRSLRWTIAEHNEFFGELINCPLCLSHWTSFVLTAIYFPRVLHSRFWIVDWFVTAMIVVALAQIPIKFTYWTYSEMIRNYTREEFEAESNP